METWEERYKRAVANYAGAPAEVPLDDIAIDVYSEDGYHYSSWTFADPSIYVRVNWPGGSKEIYGPEAVGGLIRSFLNPREA